VLLVLDELLDAPAVQRDGRRDGHVDLLVRFVRPSLMARAAAGRSALVAEVRRNGGVRPRR
jgi:hypothetical protein